MTLLGVVSLGTRMYSAVCCLPVFGQYLDGVRGRSLVVLSSLPYLQNDTVA